MNNSLDKALYYLTGNGNIDAVPVEDLEKLVNNHPYFPVAHFLLSKKLKKQNSQHFISEVQKTALYFPNPYWLHYQLLNDFQEDPFIHENTEASSDAANETAPIADIIEVDESIPNSIEENKSDGDEHPVTTEFSPEELEAASTLAHKILIAKESSENNQVQTVTVDESPADYSVEDKPDINNADAENEPRISDVFENTEEQLPAIADQEHPVSHEHNEPVTQAEEEMAAIAHETDESAVEFLNEVKNEAIEEHIHDNTEEVIPIETATEQEEDEHEKMFQNIKAMLDASSAEANAGEKSTIVPIDPYYTIDYFAAQGIKLDLEKNPQDKLGKQVKKFTQWLRHMKKLGPEDALAAESLSQAEVEAQQTADASNIAREVVTEAMAQVLEKQGKNDKAIQLYRKLTFLNPHKSAYFADKIHHLNGF